MLTENEIAALINDPVLLEAIQCLKEKFRKEEAPYLEISDHDFFCLVLLMPGISIAMAKGSISLMEEITLKKKARKISKGGYFLKKDPVVYAMTFLTGKPDHWEKEFLELIRLAMERFIDMNVLQVPAGQADEQSDPDLNQLIFSAPYLFIRFLHSFFWDESDADLTETRTVSEKEYAKIKEIGKTLQLDNTLIFRKFLDTFDVLL